MKNFNNVCILVLKEISNGEMEQTENILKKLNFTTDPMAVSGWLTENGYVEETDSGIYITPKGRAYIASL